MWRPKQHLLIKKMGIGSIALWDMFWEQLNMNDLRKDVYNSKHSCNFFFFLNPVNNANWQMFQLYCLFFPYS